MTENEAIKQLLSERDRILFDPVTGEKRTLEHVRLANENNYKLYFAYEIAIRALREVQSCNVLNDVDKCKEATKIEVFNYVPCISDELLNSEMTEQDAITYLYMNQDLLLFDTFTGESEMLEVLKQVDSEIYRSYLACEKAIEALQAVSRYRMVKVVKL